MMKIIKGYNFNDMTTGLREATKRKNLMMLSEDGMKILDVPQHEIDQDLIEMALMSTKFEKKEYLSHGEEFSVSNWEEIIEHGGNTFDPTNAFNLAVQRDPTMINEVLEILDLYFPHFPKHNLHVPI